MMRAGVVAVCLTLLGCQDQAPERPAISYKVRADNAPIQVEKEHRLAEGERVRVVIVPGFPMGDRCVIFESQASSAMACREITPRQQ